MLINWNKPDDKLDDHHQISDDQRQLTIKNIQPKHAGKYMCRAQPIANPKESDQVQIVHVLVEALKTTSTPTIQTTRRRVALDFSVNGTDTDLITLTCMVTSGRENVVSLDIRRFNKDLDEIEFKNQELAIDMSYLIVDLDNIEETYGTYICTARDNQNRLIEASTQVIDPYENIRVAQAKSNIKINMKYDILEDTGTFELNCTIEQGFPIHSLKITRGFGQDDELNFIQFYQKPDNSWISAVIGLNPSNVGRYFCVASNNVETTSTELVVADDGNGVLSLNSGLTRREEFSNQVEINPKETIKYLRVFKIS